MSIGRFYAGISALIQRTSDGRFLLLRRSPEKDFASGEWECVTGRVDQGEGFPEAARREMREELGTEARIDFILGTMHFFRGEAAAENELVGVCFCCSIEAVSAIRLSAEHVEARWVTLAEAEMLLHPKHWLATAFRHAEAIRALSSTTLMDYFQKNGFAI